MYLSIPLWDDLGVLLPFLTLIQLCALFRQSSCGEICATLSDGGILYWALLSNSFSRSWRVTEEKKVASDCFFLLWVDQAFALLVSLFAMIMWKDLLCLNWPNQPSQGTPNPVIKCINYKDVLGPHRNQWMKSSSSSSSSSSSTSSSSSSSTGSIYIIVDEKVAFVKYWC